jgi:prevent-host-death family protein
MRDLLWLASLAKSEGKEMNWNLAEAKNRFSELINPALTKGPQRVSRGKDAVIVISATDYERLTGKLPPLQGLPHSGRIVRGPRAGPRSEPRPGL